MAGCRLDDRAEAAFVAVTDRLVVHVYAIHLPVPGQMGDHGSGSAPDVENAPASILRWTQVVVEHSHDDPAPAEEPPVSVLDLYVLSIKLSLQVSAAQK
jgi:hypothetical protein